MNPDECGVKTDNAKWGLIPRGHLTAAQRVEKGAEGGDDDHVTITQSRVKKSNPKQGRGGWGRGWSYRRRGLTPVGISPR